MADLEVIFGPPGTGKTTELGRIVGQCVTEDGSDSVVLCAFTKSAARELAGRDLGIPDGHIGTLHSLCYHALDTPPIAETTWKAWNEAYPVYEMSDDNAIDINEGGGQQRLPGDIALAEVNLLRQQMIPATAWPEYAQVFHHKWTDWKTQHHAIDFTDMIDHARQVVPIAPGHPQTLIVDEAQDLSLLQWDLLTRWARHVTRWIAAGDDDQALYNWCGGTFEPLLAAPSRRVLPQSYRVPFRIQQHAKRYTNGITHRESKTWAARPTAGICEAIWGRWRDGDAWIAQIQEWLTTTQDTVAILAPCSFMLTPTIRGLRAAGIPFSNRWRRRRRDWNPLHPPRRGVSTSQRLRDFLRPTDRLWTWQELSTWLPLIRTDGVLHHGAKARIALHADKTGVCTLADLAELLLPDAIDGALHDGLGWFEYQVLQSKAKSVAYPLRVLQRYNRNALSEEPRVSIGTAHSLKGGEADRVIFYTELSKAQQLALREGGSVTDDILRMLYVGSTRARHELYAVRETEENLPLGTMMHRESF